MLPFVVGGALAGMSILSGILGNKQVAEQLKSNVNRIKGSLDTQLGNLQQQAEEANSNIALEMTSARYQGLKLSGSTTNSLVNRNIAGNTALKQYNESIMNRMFAQNVLQKKAEDTWASYGVEMNNARINANNAIYSAANQASSQTKSPLAIATSAGQAFMAGSTIESGIESLGSSLSSTAATSSGNVVASTEGSLISSAGYGANMTTVDTSLSDSYFKTIGGIK